MAALDDLVSEVEIRDLGVPLGSLFLPSFFAGRGLRLPVKVVTLNMTNADFYSSFTDCGINQSLQKIWITFSVTITFLTPARGCRPRSVTSRRHSCRDSHRRPCAGDVFTTKLTRGEFS